MATVIRIKRRLNEEPSESIFIKLKRSRKEGPEEDTSDETSTVLRRVGTVESKEEPVKPLVLKAIKKGWELKENYKKLGSGMPFQNKARLEAKKRAVSKRYKIITQNRGIGELPQLDDDDDKACSSSAEEKTANERVDAEQAEALPSSSMELTYFDAVLANEMEDVITCNGVPMEREKYVYDVFYSSQPVNWEEVMEHNMCRIETEKFESFSDSDSDDLCEYDDDENEESNWRNDYPDYDDSPYEDEEEYLNAQIRKNNRKHYDTDESYDEDDYEDESFDVDGNLIMSSNPSSLLKLMQNTRLQDSDSED